MYCYLSSDRVMSVAPSDDVDRGRYPNPPLFNACCIACLLSSQSLSIARSHNRSLSQLLALSTISLMCVVFCSYYDHERSRTGHKRFQGCSHRGAALCMRHRFLECLGRKKQSLGRYGWWWVLSLCLHRTWMCDKRRQNGAGEWNADFDASPDGILRQQRTFWEQRGSGRVIYFACINFT